MTAAPPPPTGPAILDHAIAPPDLVRAALPAVLDALRGKPHGLVSPGLGSLFRDLQHKKPSRPAHEVEDLIWAHWSNHPDPARGELMERAINALASGEHDLARTLLDELVVLEPDWAEAWNKRAILAYIEDRDAECIRDILTVLRLEPRHFGALCGFAQIALKHGEQAVALACFEAALALNPHMGQVKKAVADLSRQFGAARH